MQNTHLATPQFWTLELECSNLVFCYHKTEEVCDRVKVVAVLDTVELFINVYRDEMVCVCVSPDLIETDSLLSSGNSVSRFIIGF